MALSNGITTVFPSHLDSRAGSERQTRNLPNRKRKKTAVALTADEARAAAVAEGLELVPSSNETGYKGVRRQHGKYHSRG